MPFHCQHELRVLDQDGFGKLSYEVYAQVLAIRNELGRFFDEKIYKQALASQRTDTHLEVPVTVSHGSFKKLYYLDLLLAQCAVLEFKATDSLMARHKAQLMHYLMLANLRHGMLINVRPERVSREYVNNVRTHQERLQFTIDTDDWRSDLPGANATLQLVLDLLNDWGTGLDVGLCEEAVTHFCGGDSQVIRAVPILLRGHSLGQQNLRFVTDSIAFKFTSFDKTEALLRFHAHGQRLVNHSAIDALLWISVGRHQVSFRSICTTALR